MVPQDRIELPTSPLPRVRSATELLRPRIGRWVPNGKRAYSPAWESTEARIATLAPAGKVAAMTERPPPDPKDERAARRAEALKRNLARRKAAQPPKTKPEK